MTTFWGAGQVHVRERLLQHQQEADSRRAFGVQARCWRSTLHATGRSLGVSMGGPSFMQCLRQTLLEHLGFSRVDWHPPVAGQVRRLDTGVTEEGGFARDGGEATVGDELAVVAGAEVVGKRWK
ncbi:hypothetical protein B0H14DRAFT_2571767 [Mycena olivaceomarginata]|nr:hypothetical protein B0H14DRAFT_2571767 [Mycena olivaceomarginata]